MRLQEVHIKIKFCETGDVDLRIENELPENKNKVQIMCLAISAVLCESIILCEAVVLDCAESAKRQAGFRRSAFIIYSVICEGRRRHVKVFRFWYGLSIVVARA